MYAVDSMPSKMDALASKIPLAPTLPKDGRRWGAKSEPNFPEAV